MRNLFLSSGGLNERITKLLWKCIGKKPENTKVSFVPSAAVSNDEAREGILVCMERLMSMGIPVNNILLYDLALLLSEGYKKTYSAYIDNTPTQFRIMKVEELNQYDMIVFCGGNARLLLDEVNRTGFFRPLKEAIENGLIYLGISAGSMIAAGNFSDGLGYLTNLIMPHAEKGCPCGEIQGNDPLELSNEQVVWIQGERQEIIC